MQVADLRGFVLGIMRFYIAEGGLHAAEAEELAAFLSSCADQRQVSDMLGIACWGCGAGSRICWV